MNYSTKDTLFVMSAGPSEGYIEFFNAGRIEYIFHLDKWITFHMWDGYSYKVDFTDSENAEKNLPIILDAICEATDEDPKRLLKITDIKGVTGTDGILQHGYNGTNVLTVAK